MGTLRDDLAADMAEAIGDYDQSFEWKGKSYPCVRTTDPAALTVGPGGDQDGISDRVTVALPVFAGGRLPEQGDLVDKYALQILKLDPNVGHLVLWLGPPMNLQEER